MPRVASWAKARWWTHGVGVAIEQFASSPDEGLLKMNARVVSGQLVNEVLLRLH